jgi:hypothetical protein
VRAESLVFGLGLEGRGWVVAGQETRPTPRPTTRLGSTPNGAVLHKHLIKLASR